MPKIRTTPEINRPLQGGAASTSDSSSGTFPHPGTITATTTNSVSGGTHTHRLDLASTVTLQAAYEGGNEIQLAASDGHLIVKRTGAAVAFQVSEDTGAVTLLAAPLVYASATRFLHTKGGTMLGLGAGNLSASGLANIGIGPNALLALTTGAANVAVGDGALQSTLTGQGHVAIGYEALKSCVGTTIGNVAIGADAAPLVTSATGITALGYRALYLATTGDNSTALGSRALYNLTTGARHTAVGRDALYSMTTDSDATAVGHDSQTLNTSPRCVSMGSLSMRYGDAMLECVAIGFQAMQWSGYVGYDRYHVMIGCNAGRYLDGGYGCVGIGEEALLNADAMTWGVGVGQGVLSRATGDNNVAVGAYAGYGITSGAGNTFIGTEAGGTGTTATVNKSIAIGLSAHVTASNTFVLGGAGTDAVDGVIGGPTAASAQWHVAQAGTASAQPVLLLDQADVSEEFIRFIGGAGSATLTQSIVAEADVTTATRAGWLRVYVQDDGDQITDQAYYMPIFTLA